MSKTRAQELYQKYQEENNPLGWYEILYQEANETYSNIPWAHLTPNPNLVEWYEANAAKFQLENDKTLVVGCGLGDDAEFLASKGHQVTAFDLSESAINHCKKRFPESNIKYEVKNLFSLPETWHQKFSFIFESYTLQSLPQSMLENAISCLAECVTLGGRLLVIARGRDESDPINTVPFPLTFTQLSFFKEAGLELVKFEDYIEFKDNSIRRFRCEFIRRK